MTRGNARWFTSCVNTSETKLYVCLLRMCVPHVVRGKHACIIFKTSATKTHTHTHLPASLQKSMKNFSFRSASVPGDNALDATPTTTTTKFTSSGGLIQLFLAAANALGNFASSLGVQLSTSHSSHPELVVCSSFKIIIIYGSNTLRTERRKLVQQNSPVQLWKQVSAFLRRYCLYEFWEKFS